MIISTITEAIGSAPLYRFDNQHYSMPKGSAIYAKLEYLNPGGSIKDRLGSYLIKEGFAQGKINEKTTIIEPTAGNTGIGIALAALTYKLRTVFVVPEKFSLEKQQLMKALGAKIIHSPSEQGIIGAISKSKKLAEEISNSYLPLQFENKDNPAAYYHTLGPEIFHEIKENIHSFVAGIGSGGTFAGTSTFLKEKYPDIRIIGVEPEGSVLNGGDPAPHEIEGIGVEFIPPFLSPLSINQIETISDVEGFNYTRQLAREQGLLVGSSSGAAFAAALREIRRLPPGHRVVTIFPDAADRYLSKNIYL